MENQNNNLQELEELRSQVAEFKNRIEKQEIVSRHLLAQTFPSLRQPAESLLISQQ